MKVLIISFVPTRRNAVLDDAAFLGEQDAQVELVTADADDWPELVGRVPIHELGPAESRHPLPRLESALVFGLPRAVFTGVRALATAASSAPAMTRPARALTSVSGTLEAGWGKVARVGHNRGFVRFYRVLRPWILWRAARRQLLPLLDSVDRVVVADALGIPIGWHLARARPEVPVTLGLDRSAVTDRRAELSPQPTKTQNGWPAGSA